MTAEIPLATVDFPLPDTPMTMMTSGSADGVRAAAVSSTMPSNVVRWGAEMRLGAGAPTAPCVPRGFLEPLWVLSSDGPLESGSTRRDRMPLSSPGANATVRARLAQRTSRRPWSVCQPDRAAPSSSLAQVIALLVAQHAASPAAGALVATDARAREPFETGAL